MQDFERNGDRLSLLYTRACIAKVLMRAQEYGQAWEQLSQAIHEIETSGHTNESPEYAYVYEAVALYHLGIKRYDDCVEFSQQAAQLFDRMGFEREAAEALRSAADAYRQQGMFEHADAASQQIIDLLSRSQDRLISRLEVLGS